MDYLGKKCPICSERFHENDDVVVCPECGAPYHRACYQSRGACIFTELHEKGKTWQDPETQKKDAHTVTCPHCGTENSKDNVLCVHCGKMLYLNDTEPKPEQAETASNPAGQIPLADMNGSIPFIVLDPMGGVAPDEDFEGVTGAELAKTVKVNTPYYMSIFKALKTTGVSKFNFAALFFGGGWLLYRKQYLKGGIITAITAILYILQDFFTYSYSNSVWSIVQNNLQNANITTANITTYMSELFKLSSGEIIIAFVPYICALIVFIISVVLGFTANRSYYKHLVQKIKIAKQDKSEAELTKTLDEKGGVNRGIAYTLLLCELILSIVPFFFLS